MILLIKQKLATKTIKEYDTETAKCREIFVKKTKDYGTAWRILRPTSLTDQLFIKAQRIRSFEEKGVQKVNEGVESEYIGLVNYSIMAIIQLELPASEGLELTLAKACELYEHYLNETRELMIRKNHDYGEAWRGMRVSSLTDLILMKLLRVKQIEDNNGKTLISEGLDANYQDIINYSIFALIKLSE
ncbi:MAG: hypothetical protein ACI97N_001790 [Cognaticolwellia sp.]